MIEDSLIQYGPLGLWTATLLYDKLRHQKIMNEVIKNNTVAMTRVYEIVSNCNK